ncbi:transmembrane protein, putative (macronuclear) [Tetrahymena thermophila SB210]|uniref:Transmembrane protein, putative n=1 Tax=Tetrahymena thermophila (strain SB210) TaxID=312017 RepID=W7XDX9_TETTS|nr:transmembrane protein, putative [Tetrahymena thermophila SB210]EWS75802.1 transmembrane protein, putative [Tetrahymena thermophila SB210]|eukprot:XP_012651724.1 transmembrane protein, putative [Tetrahymena thermophila SB210]
MQFIKCIRDLLYYQLQFKTVIINCISKYQTIMPNRTKNIKNETVINQIKITNFNHKLLVSAQKMNFFEFQNKQLLFKFSFFYLFLLNIKNTFTYFLMKLGVLSCSIEAKDTRKQQQQQKKEQRQINSNFISSFNDMYLNYEFRELIIRKIFLTKFSFKNLQNQNILYSYISIDLYSYKKQLYLSMENQFIFKNYIKNLSLFSQKSKEQQINEVIFVKNNNNCIIK